MPDLNDTAYYTARASKSRAAAEAAIDPAIAAIHQQMATKYEELARLAAAFVRETA